MKAIERLTSWLGFCSGIILLGSPMELTSFTTWACPALIYFLGLNGLVYLLMTMEAHHLTYTFPDDLANDKNNLETYVSATLTVLFILIHIGLRLTFLVFAKAIPEFIGEVRRTGFVPPTTGFQHFLIWTNLVLCIAKAGVFTGIAAEDEPLEAGAQVFGIFSGRDILGSLYPAVFFCLSAFHSGLTGLVTFAFILTLTIYLRAFFEGFSDNFRREILNLTKSGAYSVNKRKVQQQKVQGQLEPGIYMLMDELQPSWLAKSKLAKQRLLAKMDNLLNVFNQYDRITGPLLLGLFSAACITFVQVMDHILVHNLSFWDKLHEWTNLFSHLEQLYLLQVGFSFHAQISKEKMELEKLLSMSPESVGKDELTLVLTVFKAWDWEMSASSFFVIDRSLVEGILSLMFAYTVILFQLQLG